MLVSPKCGACSIVTEHHDLLNDAVCPVHAEHLLEHLLERSLRRRRQQSSGQIRRRSVHIERETHSHPAAPMFTYRTARRGKKEKCPRTNTLSQEEGQEQAEKQRSG